MDLRPDERRRFLDDTCGDDPDLLAEIEGLLAHDASAVEGRRIGAFVLGREIGAGGMGKVYLAERADGQFRQRVAIKVIKRGMDTDEILRRFRNERQVLAELEHPNIARLYDGGATDDGLPYLALEFVDGVPIDRWCKQHGSTVRERIELFLLVCSAVHHAHQNLVVHRDLKPSNILVTSTGVPKLLDFGIAKVLAPGGADRTVDRTSTEQRVLTPAYASPEQLRGEPITTASDVFSLGVVLYELLVGAQPFTAGKRAAESARDETADRPSTAAAKSLRRTLAGDLDTIVLTALQSEPSRRYASVDQLAADLRRYLHGMPVLARRDSFGYRASKFVGRNKILVGATLVLFLALAGGFTASTILYFQAVRAQAAEVRERELAERRFAEVRNLATKFIFDVHQAIEPLQGSLPARQLIVKTATEYLERLARERRDDPALQLQLAQSWVRIGEIQSSRGRASFGNTEAALVSYQRALASARDLVLAEPSNANYGLLLVRTQIHVVEVLEALKRLPEARDLCAESFALDERLAAFHPETAAFECEKVHAHSRLAEILLHLGDSDGALEHHHASTAISETLARDWPGDATLIEALGETLEREGEMLDAKLRHDEALSLERRALSIFETLVASEPDRASFRREIAVCRHRLARIHNHQGCSDEACDESRACLEVFEALARGDDANSAAVSDLASALGQHGGLLLAAGRAADAIPCLERSIERFGELVVRDPSNMELRTNLAMADGFLGEALIATGRADDGLGVLHEGCREFEAICALEASDAAVQNLLFLAYGGLGSAYVTVAQAAETQREDRVRSLREGRMWLERSLEGLAQLRSEGHTTAGAEARSARLAEILATCIGSLGSAQ
jgi:non-specific serine/threonine protein kinase/serine/threonine-protein kinase